VTGSGASRTVSITHPGAAGWVALRAAATDNAVEQTIINAYMLKAK
jgi:hypothetical protein